MDIGCQQLGHLGSLHTRRSGREVEVAGIYTGDQDVHGFESWTERPMSEIYRRHIVCRIGLKTVGAVLSKHVKVIIEMSRVWHHLPWRRH